MFTSKTFLKNILLVSIVLFAGLFAAELTLRVTTSPPPFGKIDIFTFGAEYSLSSDPKLIYVPKPNTGEFNAYGHREYAYPFQKTGKKRILVMGDSVVEGFDVKTQDRFTEKLGQQLSPGYEVINLGVCGYNFDQEFEYFIKLGQKFQPDTVLWGITYNDMLRNSPEIFTLSTLMEQRPRERAILMEYYRVKNQLEKILLHSRLYLHLTYLIRRFAKENFEKAVYHEISQKEALRALLELKKMSRKANFRLIFVFLPVNTQAYADQIEGFQEQLKTTGFEMVDLRKSIPESQKSDLFLFPNEPCHLNEKGHELVAQLLFKKIHF